jgi:hypothetical protein
VLTKTSDTNFKALLHTQSTSLVKNGLSTTGTNITTTNHTTARQQYSTILVCHSPCVSMPMRFSFSSVLARSWSLAVCAALPAVPAGVVVSMSSRLRRASSSCFLRCYIMKHDTVNTYKWEHHHYQVENNCYSIHTEAVHREFPASLRQQSIVQEQHIDRARHQSLTSRNVFSLRCSSLICFT